MDACCRIELFGELRVRNGDIVVNRFRTQKAATLLSYLALHLGQRHSREKLLDLFWPEMDLDAGRDNLSSTLSLLRRQIAAAGVPADRVLRATHQHVDLDPAAVATDVDEFEQHLKAAAHTEGPVERAGLLERAAELYRGELLPGCYEEWALQEQRRWSERYADALEQWTAALEEVGNLEGALVTAQRAVQADPYREAAYRTQMRLYGALGRAPAALETYRELKRFLKEELSISPAAVTADLAEQLRRDPNALLVTRPVPSPRRAPAGGEAEPQGPPPAPARTAELLPLATLPLQLTRFFGREEEIAHLCELLLGAQEERAVRPGGVTPHDLTRDGARLVTLTGPGGAGKTRLAIEVARRLSPALEGRVWFVDLAGLPGPNLLPFAVAHALELPSTADPVQGVVEALGQAPCLLLLDNFEHLLRDTGAAAKSENPAAAGGGTALVRLLLERVPGLICLVTSRQPLHLGGERECPVPPLAVPGATASPACLLECTSVALYTDRAQAARPDFAITPQNAAAVATLCRKLDGMPLSIEMAAAWAKTLPPARMLERLERQLDLLVDRRRDLPPRHQSLRATIEWSYDLLSPELRDCFARLSVFRGGWTLEAAEAVCGDGALMLLTELQEQSLIVVEERGEETRFRMLETLREYALEKLVERGKSEPTRSRHAGFFLALAEEAWSGLRGPEMRFWLNRLQRDYENLSAALEWCQSETVDAEISLQLAGALRRFWELRGTRAEGRRCLEGALARTSRRTAIRVRALNAAGNLAREGHDLKVARQHFAEALEIVLELGDRRGEAEARNNLGLVALNEDDHETARVLHEQSLAIARDLGDERAVAENLYNLGELARQRGDLAEARTLWEECCTLEQRIGVKGGYVLWRLGYILMEQGEYAEARRLWTDGLTQCREIGFESGVAKGLDLLAGLAVAEDQFERGARLWGASTALWGALGGSLSPGAQETFERNAARIRAALGEEAFATAFAAGRAMTFEEAAEYALGGVGR